MIFKQHQSREQGLSDLFNYAHLIDDGVIINKDGAFLSSFKFRGPDINSATIGELDSLTANFNRLATHLEDGWLLHIDDLRIPSLAYPSNGSFPDNVSSLIDEERRQLYEQEGAHYENLQFLTFVWKFPLPLVKTTRHWFVEGLEKKDKENDLTNLLQYFKDSVQRFVGLLSTQLILDKLSSADLLSYLNTCISGEIMPVAVPPDGCFIDVLLGRNPVIGGYNPKIGKKHIKVLSIIGYLNQETTPGLLENMSTYPLIYRWSNRFIPLSESTAEREIKRYQKNWNNKVKGLAGIIREVIFNAPTNKVNQDALQMSRETQDALTINSNHSVRFGYWTSEIIIMNESVEVMNEAITSIQRYINNLGFKCIEEDINALDAWLGTIPGHGSANIRRVFLNSENLAHLLPLHSIWAGAPYSSTASLLPPYSPPVFYAATTGKTPFRFNLDVSDVGHQIVLGPTGSGKSTYLDFLIAQFLRYANAQIYVFDKDFSHLAITTALCGNHYDIGNADKLSFCPLADLSTKSKQVKAEQFIENLVELQNIPITPDIRSAIHTAMINLAEDANIKSRTLTDFSLAVQHHSIRDALKYYTLEGQMPLLDAEFDSIQAGYLQTFEMSWLLSQKPEVYIPVLLHIFNQIELNLESSNSKNPTLIILEEAWLYISNKLFATKMKGWLKTLRKFNARVIFVTQSLSDLYDPATQTLTHITATLMESCPTKIYLPNNQMDEEIAILYKKMGLNSRQLEIISKVAIQKRHYYVVNPEGNRLIDLGFNDSHCMALSFLGLSKSKTEKLLTCKVKYGDNWVYYWLKQHGFDEWGEYWQEHYQENNIGTRA